MFLCRLNARLYAGRLMTILAIVASGIPLPAQIPQSSIQSVSMPAHCMAKHGEALWLNTSESSECRALQLISHLSHDEKLVMLGAIVNPEAPPLPRVGLPNLSVSDGPNGIADANVVPTDNPKTKEITAFPTALSLAATWDTGLAHEFGNALGEEFSAKGISVVLGPTANLLRTWHWGRSAETFGEDPFLITKLIVPEIMGLQKNHVIAMIKHYAANGQENNRCGVFPDFSGVDERMSEKALHEMYLPQFEAAVTQAHVGSIMCSYNQINGIHSCTNKELLSHLREIGFDGLIVPDALYAQRRAIDAVDAGVDLISPITELDALINAGRLTEDDLNRMLFHALMPAFRLGAFETATKGSLSAAAATPAHLDLARRIALRGAVLLKNDREILPLQRHSVRSIAVIGDNAGTNAVVMETGSPRVPIGHLSVPAEAIRTRAARDGIEISVHTGLAPIRALPPIPMKFLHPISGEGSGLAATYYPTAYWYGPEITTASGANVNYDAIPVPRFEKTFRSPDNSPTPEALRDARRAPLPNGDEDTAVGPPTAWSAVWKGMLTPERDGVYTFSLSAAGNGTLYIDQKQIAAVVRSDLQSVAIGSVYIRANRPVPIEVKYSSDSSVIGSLTSGVKLGWQEPNANSWKAAIDAAAHADVAIVFAGEQLGEGYDKTHLSLPGDQDRLIEEIAAVNHNTLVVLNTSTPVAMPWVDKVAAIIEDWYPGQVAGETLASLLFGDANFSGRLPVTFPKDETQGPAKTWQEYPGDGHSVLFNEGVFVGYRWYLSKGEVPLFPFGYGLSYTTFKYGSPKVVRESEGYSIQIPVTNTGSMEGVETVQLYVGYPPEVGEPLRQLKGFQQAVLQPGATANVQIPLIREELRTWNEDTHSLELKPGKYTIEIGSSSQAILAHLTLQIDHD